MTNLELYFIAICAGMINDLDFWRNQKPNPSDFLGQSSVDLAKSTYKKFADLWQQDRITAVKSLVDHYYVRHNGKEQSTPELTHLKKSINAQSDLARAALLDSIEKVDWEAIASKLAPKFENPD